LLQTNTACEVPANGSKPAKDQPNGVDRDDEIRWQGSSTTERTMLALLH
jgi:hypothetical protein